MANMVSKEDIQNLAQLARLELSDEETTSLQKDMSNILEYVGQISAVSADAQTVVPENHNVMRADTPRAEGDPMAGKRDAVLAALPKREGDYNVVRKIIQKDE
ncbi:MAG: Asp-tRNA(Asn)/Glu-tRNA(Gln) amidotransferase subunit GatC [Candidatus Pacebacteria bacterium]|nr:Asp-tRNA(Asn)/Glu-tRNA(Gln) amidotransferase subunit GatC [Candidatus Paceibacterota bacterium]